MLPPGDQALLDAVLAAPGERAATRRRQGDHAARIDPRRSSPARRRASSPRCPSRRSRRSGSASRAFPASASRPSSRRSACSSSPAAIASPCSRSIRARACRAARSSATRRAWSGSRSTRGAFVRPSPSGGTLGGVATATREAIRVVEAAGYDIVVVETVGVGQSEAAVAGMTDMFVLLQLPNAGDDLQAIKKGVMELADLVVVNKADLDAAAAARAVGQIESALHLVARRAGDGWTPQVLATSALAADQVAAVWQVVAVVSRGAAGAAAPSPSAAAARRAPGSGSASTPACARRFAPIPQVRAQLADTLAAVEAGRLPVSVAARRLLASARRRHGPNRLLIERPTLHARHHPAARSQARPRPPRRRPEAHRRAARQGQADRARAHRPAARRRHVRGMGHVRRAPQPRLRHGDQPPARRRRRHRLRHDQRPAGLRLQPGLHRLRRRALGSARREDLQGDGPGDEGRRAGDRPQRLGRRAHPGRRRLARRLRRGVPEERHRLGRRAADQHDHGPVRRRRGLLAGDDRLHLHGQGQLVHVRHRPRGREDGDARGGERRGPRRRAHAHDQERRRRPRLRQRRRGAGDAAPLLRLPAAQQPREGAAPAERRPGRARSTSRSTRWCPTTRTSRTTSRS